MKNLVNIQKIFIITLAFIIVVCCLTYKYNLSAVSNDSEVVKFEIKENQTFSTISDELKESNLIRSEFFYKLYVKLMKPEGLKVGIYNLNRNMSVDEIINHLSTENGIDVDNITVTFKEGLNMRKIISLIVENTNNKEEDVINTLKDKKYLQTLIDKYWFLDDEILNKDIYYSLEGYLYPNTYEINKKWSIDKIFEVMLNEMDKKLSDYKEKINKSDYSVHELITLASIIELEGSNSNDRNGISGVFYNRLNAGWSLGSDVTTYYGVKVDLSERDLYQSEINTYNNYNTRHAKMAGKLPIGPICNPSINSIEAAINPKDHNYYYFVADKNKKTYFTKTSSEHVSIIQKLKSEKLWYEYN